MCDYSLRHLASRPAKVDDKLVVSKFHNSISIGFVDAAAAYEKINEVVCVLPGTELAFGDNITQAASGHPGYGDKEHAHNTARFRQINLENPHTHHDALELPSGAMILLHSLKPGQTATVLQLPATPKTAEEAEAQARLEVVA
jgi:alpha-ketoglutarate-dependent taurine dioxygenase